MLTFYSAARATVGSSHAPSLTYITCMGITHHPQGDENNPRHSARTPMYQAAYMNSCMVLSAGQCISLLRFGLTTVQRGIQHCSLEIVVSIHDGYNSLPKSTLAMVSAELHVVHSRPTLFCWKAYAHSTATHITSSSSVCMQFMLIKKATIRRSVQGAVLTGDMSVLCHLCIDAHLTTHLAMLEGA